MANASKDLLLRPIGFGRFRLNARERLLLMDGRPVSVGSRAFDLLLVLVANAPNAVAKRVLMAEVWPDVRVDEGSLRVQVTALRRVLGDAEGRVSYIVTLPGRGYAFVGKLAPAGETPALDAPNPSYVLPARLEQIVGRDHALRAVSAQLGAERFVSIVGPGGIGKTTLALWLGHESLRDFAGQVCMVDLGLVKDPDLVGATVASALGVTVSTDAVIPAITAFLHQRRLLLILDSCEHVIDSVAALAEHIHLNASGISILVTSREALRVQGERTYQLAALDAPLAGEAMNAATALDFSAVRLFVVRAMAADRDFRLSDGEAPVVAEMCRSLGGIPLAIELAASGIAAFGIVETARLLSGSIPLEWRGRRTAPPRQQTLAATIDWSYALLLEPERSLLRRLAIFVGNFDIASAKAIAVNEFHDEQTVLDSIVGLAAKSLLTMKSGAKPSYRLLDTTRAYAFQKLQGQGELSEVARLHARYVCNQLSHEKDLAAGLGPAVSAASAWDIVGNVRAALEWCFGAGGDTAIGTELASIAAMLFLRLSLLTECIRWTELALTSLDQENHDPALEMELRGSLGISLMFTNGNSKRVLDALECSLLLAERVDALDRQLQLLGWLNVVHLRMGRIREALAFATRCAEVARRLGDKYAIATANGFLGSNYNLLGRNSEAETLLTAALENSVPTGSPVKLGFSARNHVLTSLALTLWVRGRPERAVAIALETIEEAVRLGHPGTLCIALLYSLSVFLWAGELDRAETYVELFMAEAERFSFAPYIVAGRGIKGEIAIRRGQAEAGVPMLLASLQSLRREQYQRRVTIFCCALAEGLMQMGRHDEALATIDDAIAHGRRHGELVALPEMLRVKGQILVRSSGAGPQTGEVLLLQSIDCARSQDALGWELRGATSLAALWFRQGRFSEGAELLTDVHGRCKEGFAMADLRAAHRLMDELKGHVGSMQRPE